MKLVIASTLAVALVAQGLLKLRAASEQQANAQQRLVALSHDAAELRSRGSAANPVSTGPRPQPGLVTKVTSTLAESGVDPSALRSLAPDPHPSPVSGGNDPLLRQTARLTLEPMTLPELGEFLDAWRRSSEDWSFVSIRISPLPDEPGGIDHPIRAELTIESIFVDNGSPTP